MKKIRLYRMRIKDLPNENRPIFIKPNDTHLMSVECYIGKDKYSTSVKSLEPKYLRKTYNKCLEDISNMHVVG